MKLLPYAPNCFGALDRGPLRDYVPWKSPDSGACMVTRMDRPGIADGSRTDEAPF